MNGAQDSSPQRGDKKSSPDKSSSTDWDRAISDWTALTTAPDQALAAAACFNLAHVYLERQQFDDAADTCLLAIQKGFAGPRSIRLKAAVAAATGDGGLESAAVETLRSHIASSTTLGEVTAFIEGALRQLPDSKTTTGRETGTHALAEMLSVVENHELVGARVYRFVFQRLRHLSKSELAASAVTRMRNSHLLSGLNRLEQVLVLPEVADSPQ